MNPLYRRLNWFVTIMMALITAVLFASPHPTPAAAAPTATFTVTKTADTADGTCDADCSLREAIIAANASGGADTITLPAGTYTLALAGSAEDASATGDLDITGDLTINGAGPTATIIDANDIDRVVQLVTTTGTTYDVTISNLTIRNGGNVPVGPDNIGAGIGQISNTTGIVNLTLNNVIITSNTNVNNGGGIGFARNITAIGTPTLTINTSVISSNTAPSGGGIECNGCLLNLNNSTVSGNTASGPSGNGGGINVSNNNSVVRPFNSTVSGNFANQHGGGIAKIIGTGSITVNFTTITSNTADADSSGTGDGGGIYANNNTTIQNSIVQGNTDNSTPALADCNSSINVTSAGYNVVGSGTGCPIGGTGDTTAAANLGALQVNGTKLSWLPTHLPGGGSAASERIPNGSSGCVGGTSIDQRGGVRADGLNRGGAACDSGSVEADTLQTPTAVSLSSFTASSRVGGWVGLLLWGGTVTAVLRRRRRQPAQS